MLAIFSLAVAIKIIILYYIAEPVIFGKYPFFAEKLSMGMDIGERILDLSPLYLFFTTIFYYVFGPNWDLLILLQILLGSLNCLLVYHIGSKIFGEVAGLIAAVLFILYGNITLIELTLEPEVLLLFLNSLLVLALLKAWEMDLSSSRYWKWFLPGALIGLSAITKANGLLIIPGGAVWIYFSEMSWKNKFKTTGFLMLGILIVIAPITVRNYMQFKDYVLITADGGKVFYHGNGPGATGMERADLPDQGFIEEMSGEPDSAHKLFRETARKRSNIELAPSECSEYWFKSTIEYMREKPGDAICLAWNKFFLFWNDYEIHDLDSTYKDYMALQKWPLLRFGLLSVLGLLGMVTSLNRFRQTFLIYWMVLVYLISSVVFFPASRYRLPAVPFLCIFASGFIVDWCRSAKHKGDVFKYVGMLALIPVFMAWTYLPFREEIELFDRWQQTSRIDYSLGGRMMFKKGDYQNALKKFIQVVSVDPNFTPAYNYMGKTHAILGNFEQAQECFQKVISISPGVDEGYLNQGLLSELKGEYSTALYYYEKALHINPNNRKARTHYTKLKKTIS